MDLKSEFDPNKRRTAIETHVEQFLQRGGKIEHVPTLCDAARAEQVKEKFHMYKTKKDYRRKFAETID